MDRAIHKATVIKLSEDKAQYPKTDFSPKQFPDLGNMCTKLCPQFSYPRIIRDDSAKSFTLPEHVSCDTFTD